MNVGELLERVRLEIFNDLTDTQIIGRFNELSKRLFRKFVLPEKIYKFETTEIPFYELPADCPEDRIRCVVVDDLEYLKVTPEIQNPPAYWCTVLVNGLYIHPPQSEGLEAYLYYRQRPDNLRASSLSCVPDFPSDYHELYVYDAAGWIAGLQRDVDMRNNFQSEFNAIYQDAERDLKKMGLRRAKETTRW